ncbi:MAG TPA: rod shape-determining protein [Candidatus Parcubacteria bacterium]|jgi:rod shape-determining protein MreB|nr:rod shape-determining protein [Candidatus Parcubacteria bacterium]
MFNPFSYFSKDIAIDLGTATTLVYVRGQGIVIFEPSVVAVNKKTGQILAIGNEAKKMVGRTPAHIIATRPLIKGVISDFEVTEHMLRYFIEKVHRQRFLISPRPRVIIGIPYGVTEVEKKAVEDATKSAGAREVYLIEQPMAAAIGARLPVQEAGGNFIIDIGGGTTQVAVISLGGLVLAKSLRIAGDKLNEDIVNFAREEYKLLIGERMAEEIKIGIGSASPLKEKREMPLRGRNLVTGFPEEIMVSDQDIRRALEKSVRQMVQTIKTTIEETPPELLADIMVKGIYLVGGGSLLKGFSDLVTKETKIPTKIIEDPLTAVARGAGMVLENLDELRDVLADTEELEPPR